MKAAPQERSWTRHPIVAGAAATVLGGVVLSIVTFALPEKDDGGAGATPPPTSAGSLLLVNSERDWGLLADGTKMAVVDDLDLEAYPPITDVPEVIRKVYEDGAVDARDSRYDVVLENAADSTVTITDAQVRFIERQPPDPSAYLYFEGAGANEVLSLYFDLDDPHPTALEYNSVSGPMGPYFSSHAITLTPHETIPLKLTGHAEHFDCVWVLELTIVHQGKSSVVTVDDHGQPFRTVGDDVKAPGYNWAWWEESPSFQPADGG